jgi:hypothetical protein
MRVAATAVAGVTGLVIGAGIVGAVAVASIPDKSGAVHGCVAGGANSKDPNTAGTLRVIDPATQKCPSGDQALTFNQPAKLPIFASRDASAKLKLIAHHRRTVLATTISIPAHYDMWTQPSIQVRTGNHAATITLQLLVDGKPDERPILEHLGPDTEHNIAGVLLCNGLKGGAHTISVALTSSNTGATTTTRAMLVQAAAHT